MKRVVNVVSTTMLDGFSEAMSLGLIEACKAWPAVHLPLGFSEAMSLGLIEALPAGR